MGAGGKISTPSDGALELDQMYRDAVVDFAENDDADRLEWAYHIARSALRSGLPLASISDAHFSVVRGLRGEKDAPTEREQRLEVFFLEVIAVHDMALRGYKDGIRRLEDEVAERTRAEQELREVSEMLAMERDRLDAKVKERTAEIKARADELRQTNEKLVQVNREQAEFTYAISHDLKSPANTIKMMLDILSEDCSEALNDQGRTALDAAIQTTGRMALAVEGVLNYSRTIEEDPDQEMVDLTSLMNGILADLKADIVANDAVVRLGQLPTVTGNALQLRMLFQNLISNAVKFRSADRAPIVDIALKTAEGTQDCDATTTIAVADNGIGIEPEYQDRIFDLFQRLHTHDAYPGTGIGLALCKRIVGNHGGDISVSSVPGKGSEFSISLSSTGMA